MPFLRIWFISLILLLASSAFAEDVEVHLYAYHLTPPFVIDSEARTGINFDLVDALNQSAAPGVRFLYHAIDRPALNALLAKGEPAVVMWASPAWFAKVANDVSWSDPLFWDKDVIVVRRESTLDYARPQDLEGLRVGTRAGYVYGGIDELDQQRRLQRVDAADDLSNIHRLLEGEVDCIVISKSSLLYQARRLRVMSQLKVVGPPHNTYQRQLMITAHYRALAPSINAAVGRLAQQEFWNSRVVFYGLQSLQ